ncbi:hypothetical protein HPP92_011887 [Vanilla planifolia]|uniref:Stomatal closure-related actin-binding protein 1 n=1 Tax=Vanilla planifolia TaxID=51239 RepID=A0A835UYV9_VANPL|nr:hypothetical protein HPP92_011887 [Vanilla planifolia]
MTRTARSIGFGSVMHKEALRSVSSDVNFASTRFPNYTISANNALVELNEDPKIPSLKEVVAKETAQLLEQQQRLSVRDLAKRFEKGLATAAKLSNEARSREVASLDCHVLLKKLRDMLEKLRDRVVGRNKDDVDEAISMVEALAAQLSQIEGELFLEKEEVKKLAAFLKEATEDAKKVIEEERARAHTEIGNARAAVKKIEQDLNEQDKLARSGDKQDLEELRKEVQEARRIKMLHQPTKEERARAHTEIGNARAAVKKIEQDLNEQDKLARSGDKQDLEELRKEVQEARRIKMLHQPTRVMDMEHEIQALRTQLVEKSMYTIQLNKELEMRKKAEENNTCSYELKGLESLGSCLQIISQRENSLDFSGCLVQWYRVYPGDGKKELISGATNATYAPEPFDVSCFLEAEVVVRGKRETLRTTKPIDPAAGLGGYLESLLRKSEAEFNVVVLKMNGNDLLSNSLHVFHVGKLRLKLSKGKSTKAKEFYSSAMQLCGVRCGGTAAAQSLFWHAKKGLSFTIAFECSRERNVAIMLARRFAYDCNIVLAGPNDRCSGSA